MLIPKGKYVRSIKYRRWIASKSCLVCGRSPCQAAHVKMAGGAGMGLKPCDTKCVPLCPDCHTSQHQHNERKWWQMTGIDVLKKIKDFNLEYKILMKG